MNSIAIVVKEETFTVLHIFSKCYMNIYTYIFMLINYRDIIFLKYVNGIFVRKRVSHCFYYSSKGSSVNLNVCCRKKKIYTQVF